MDFFIFCIVVCVKGFRFIEPYNRKNGRLHDFSTKKNKKNTYFLQLVDFSTKINITFIIHQFIGSNFMAESVAFNACQSADESV